MIGISEIQRVPKKMKPNFSRLAKGIRIELGEGVCYLYLQSMLNIYDFKLDTCLIYHSRYCKVHLPVMIQYDSNAESNRDIN